MTAIDEVSKELDDVRKQLSGYDELKARGRGCLRRSPSSRVLLLLVVPQSNGHAGEEDRSTLVR